ncbi:MAG: ThuA domain-containing protein [Opitutales bacterium]|jgi:type 1 glutamine amidotransferase|nr:ThuA domain-containing protein [Opitutales bacterium]
MTLFFRSVKYLVSILLLGCVVSTAAVGKDKKLVLIAGKPSHPPMMHEFRAGALLLEKCLEDVKGLTVEVHDNGWVNDEATFDDADAVVIFADGGKKHPALQGDNLKTLQKLIDRGVGFGAMHYGVEVPPGEANEEFQAWIGGHYENSFSCNPIWAPRFDTLPEHPVTQGVLPFSISDEWYFNMRFFGGISGNQAHQEKGIKFTPILVAKPSDDVRNGPYVHPKGPYDHIIENSGREEAMLWVVERPDGGRGFGFTGGHYHLNWADENFRKVVLNTLNWVSKNKIPKNGIRSKVTKEELYLNLDKKDPR